MIGTSIRVNPTVQIPPWDSFEEAVVGITSPFTVNSPSACFNGNAGGGDSFLDSLTALHRYLPSNEFAITETNSASDEFDAPVDAFSSDHFRMFEFKVRRCARGRSHDWTECPYAHPGEKARRRDPRKYHYSGTACPEFRKASCKKGEACEFAHGVFECWLHPARYRTQPCKDGISCRRRVCFFAHSAEQLRILPQQSSTAHESGDSYDGSPIRHGLDSYFATGSITSPPISSPSDLSPTSPNSPTMAVDSFNSTNELVSAMRSLQLRKMRMSPQWGSVRMASVFGSPRGSALRPGFSSMPSTPIATPTRSGASAFDMWEQTSEEEPPMERVESGRDLRAQMYARLSKENSLSLFESTISAPDVGWVSELVK